MQKGNDKDMQKKRIMLLVPTLVQGGFERVCVLTGQLLKDTYEVYLVVFNGTGRIYDVSGVNYIDLQLGAVDRILGKLINVIKRTIKVTALLKSLKIDVVYSFGITANLVNAMSVTRAYKIGACHSYGEIQNKRYMQLVSKRIHKIICCSKVMKDEVKERYHIKNIETVWNPCDIEGIQELSRQPLQEHIDFFKEENLYMISMGREDDIKGFWHLIKAFKLVNNQKENTRLVIVGEGKFEEYKALASELNLEEKLLFTGVQLNPFSYLAKGQLYVLTSISEGLPNALVEALCVELPIVSANCKSGPAEILSEEYKNVDTRDSAYEAEYGILVPPFDPEKNMDSMVITKEERLLAETILLLIGDKEKYLNYKRKCLERAKEFGKQQYANTMIELIEKAM